MQEDKSPDAGAGKASDANRISGASPASGARRTSGAGRSSGSGRTSATDRAYWRANLKVGAVLLLIWFVVSFGFGILLLEPLNRITFFGFKLGFWWAQQGSIFVFVILIFVYAALMKRIDRRYDVHDDED